MISASFNLRSAFAVTALCAVALWAVTVPTVVSCAAAFGIIVLIVAIWAGRRDGSFAIAGLVAGGGAVIAFLLIKSLVGICDYFAFNRPPEFYEDGAEAEFVLYPILCSFVYTPFGALLGLALGAIVWCIGDHYNRPARAERPTTQ